MKKGLGLICFVIGLCIAFGACSDSDTYADRLKNERKNISRFINEHDIVILSKYPANGVFKENEYFEDPETGVYLNVVDSGNGNRATEAKRSEVTIRFRGAMTLPTAEADTATNDLLGLQPMTIYYGITASYIANSTSTNIDYYYLSPGLVAPLKYVGEKGRVKLIVPFATGSSFQTSQYIAMYYTEVEYKQIIN